jgi:hypothetical protein
MADKPMLERLKTLERGLSPAQQEWAERIKQRNLAIQTQGDQGKAVAIYGGREK